MGSKHQIRFKGPAANKKVTLLSKTNQGVGAVCPITVGIENCFFRYVDFISININQQRKIFKKALDNRYESI